MLASNDHFQSKKASQLLGSWWVLHLCLPLHATKPFQPKCEKNNLLHSVTYGLWH